MRGEKGQLNDNLAQKTATLCFPEVCVSWRADSFAGARVRVGGAVATGWDPEIGRRR